MPFKSLQLSNTILKAVSEKNYSIPTPIQDRVIPLVLERKDIIASAHTGTGKTAAFALPILELLRNKQDTPKKNKNTRALIICPTRELAVQIKDDFKVYGKYTNLRTTVVFGGTSIEPQKDVLSKGVDILVATPGRLLDLNKQNLINLDNVDIFVIDEADLMLDMGFIDDVKKIERLCPAQKQTLLFSATIPYKVEQLAKAILKLPEKVQVSPKSSVTENIIQWLYFVPKSHKIKLCLHLLRNTIKGNIIIFRRTKFGVEKLENALLKKNYTVDSIHGGKTQSGRQTALNKFINKEIHILIATDVAARGIDIDKLDAVINFDLPNVAETYVHRIGRTGRAGNSGIAYSFCSAEEKNHVLSIQKLLHTNIPVEENHPYPLDPKAKPESHKKTGSKHRKGRKSAASKKKKKRWY